ncbi:hypothetical protein EN794_025625 [Mesorhizobium sp. M00.F.Ca.ET.151.01.1.1]|nr:hypothetical protein EN794_025625 [Mesorhizobium sp. M00.F.Ca.ET.151.01.1.1]
MKPLPQLSSEVRPEEIMVVKKRGRRERAGKNHWVNYNSKGEIVSNTHKDGNVTTTKYANSGKTVIRSKLGGPWYSENVFDGDKKFRRKKAEATGCVFPFLLICSGAVMLGAFAVSMFI